MPVLPGMARLTVTLYYLPETPTELQFHGHLLLLKEELKHRSSLTAR